MFAIAKVGARQYKVTEDELISIPRVSKKKEVSLDKILIIVDGKDVAIGTPHIKGSKVVCEVLGDSKGPKRIAFKFKRRKSSQKTIGHRDLLTQVRVKNIIKG